MSGYAAREQLAAVVAGAVPDGWTVYATPPEQPSIPAAVIVPRSPYRRPGTFCSEIMGVEVRLMEARSSGEAGINSLDGLSATVRDAILASDGIVYESTDLGNLSQWGGVETIDARLLLELYIT